MMQYYLDGPKNNFFTFFFVRDRNSNKINNNTILKTHNFLKNKSLNKITYSQLRATQNVFKSKKIPFRTFLVNERNLIPQYNFVELAITALAYLRKAIQRFKNSII